MDPWTAGLNEWYPSSEPCETGNTQEVPTWPCLPNSSPCPGCFDAHLSASHVTAVGLLLNHLKDASLCNSSCDYLYTTPSFWPLFFHLSFPLPQRISAGVRPAICYMCFDTETQTSSSSQDGVCPALTKVLCMYAIYLSIHLLRPRKLQVQFRQKPRQLVHRQEIKFKGSRVLVIYV